MSVAATAFVPASRANLGGLLWTLVRTDFKVRYHGTVMGFVWALLKPAAMFAVLLAVFSFVFPNDPNYKLNLILGLFLWDFFAESTRVGLLSLAAKGYLLAKTPFPRWVVVVTSLSNPALTLAVMSTIALLFLTAFGAPPGPLQLALFALYLGLFAAIVLGLSLGASVLFLRYRDLNQVWEVVTQAGFFVAPIVYPLSALPERWHLLLFVWPPTPVIHFAREVLVEGRIPTLKAHLCLLGVAATVLGAGVALYRAYEPRIAERL